MQHRLRRAAGGKPSSVLDRAAHAVVAERDLALQAAASVRSIARVVGACRPRACRCRAAARRSPRRRGRCRGSRADRAHRLRDGERVLEQAVAVGLVVAASPPGRGGSAPTSREPSPKNRASSAGAGADRGPSRRARAGPPPSGSGCGAARRGGPRRSTCRAPAPAARGRRAGAARRRSGRPRARAARGGRSAAAQAARPTPRRARCPSDPPGGAGGSPCRRHPRGAPPGGPAARSPPHIHPAYRARTRCPGP